MPRSLPLPLPLLALALLVVLAASTLPAAAQFGGGFGRPEQRPVRLQAELAWYEGRLIPGREANLGVVLTVAPGWHVQAGARSGADGSDYLATTITARLPEGWRTGDVRWPEAEHFRIGSGEFAIEAAGYGGRSIAVIPVVIPPDATPGDHRVEVTIVSQACDDKICEMQATLTVAGRAVVLDPAAAEGAAAALDAELAALFAATLSRAVPTADAIDDAADDGGGGAAIDVGSARWWIAAAFVWAAMLWMAVSTIRLGRHGASVAVVVIAAGVMYGSFSFVRSVTSDHGWTPYTTAAFERARAEGQTILIKFTADWCANCQVNEQLILHDDDAMAELARPDVVAMKVDFTGAHPEGDAKKAELGGGGIPLIAVYAPDRPEPVVIRGQLASATPVVDALRGEFVERAADEQVFDFLNVQFAVGKDATLLIFGLAFLAGFFMNFTPCVLPVIPLKILSLQSHAKDPARCFALGVVFGLGIVALYAALGVLMAGVISGLDRLDWGDLFQFWWFTGPIGLVVGLMALGMMGLFAVRLPQFLYMFNPQSDTVGGSFFMGVFTAVLSTPCTGPLLGATVAWVALQPAAVAFLTLVVMGLGMAFPYVLLTARPRWLEHLPRSGPGSVIVKQVMGLLLLAVSVWFIGTAAVGFLSAS